MPIVFPGVDAPLQAVIFDFDGVIVESMAIKTAAFRALFADHADKQDEIVALHLRHAGIDRLTKIEMIHRDILRLPLSETRRHALAWRFEALVEERVSNCPMVEGAAALLGTLNGCVPLAVVSGTPEPELRRVVARRGLAHHFRTVCGSPPGKSALVRAMLAQERWEANRVLMLGDADSDAEAARDNGLAFIGRVAPGERNPFPAGTPVVPDLVGLAHAAVAYVAATL